MKSEYSLISEILILKFNENFQNIKILLLFIINKFNFGFVFFLNFLLYALSLFLEWLKLK